MSFFMLGPPDVMQQRGDFTRAISGVSATITGGKLQISSTNPADDITFSQDTSGVLVVARGSGRWCGCARRRR